MVAMQPSVESDLNLCNSLSAGHSDESLISRNAGFCSLTSVTVVVVVVVVVIIVVVVVVVIVFFIGFLFVKSLNLC